MNNTTTGWPFLYSRYSSQAAILEEFSPAAIMAERIIPPIWYTVGFIGNPISAFVWLGQRMRRNNSSAIYLGALSISDTFFLILHILYILHVAWGYVTYNYHIGCEIFNFLFLVPQYLSVFLVLGFTCERYVAVCHPFLKEKLCTVRRAVVIVLCLIIISVALSSAQIYIWTYKDQFGLCIYREDDSTSNKSFTYIWTWSIDITVFMIGTFIVLLFNILVLKEIFKISKNDLMRRQQNRSGNSTASTLTLLAVSFYLIITQLSATIVNCLEYAFPQGSPYMTDEEIRSDKTWSNLFTYYDIRKIIETICLSHNACYFFIYCLTGKHFRREVLYLVTLQGRMSVLSSCVSKKRRQEQYSMMSTNGGHNTETYVTTFSTTI